MRFKKLMLFLSLFFVGILFNSCEPIIDNCGEYGCGEGGKCVDVSKNLTDIFEPFDKILNKNEIVEYEIDTETLLK